MSFRTINPSAPLFPTSHGQIDLGKILDQDAYAAKGAFPAKTELLASLHSHDSGARDHLSGISSVSISLPLLSDSPDGAFDNLLQQMIWEGSLPGLSEPFEIMRCKGFLQNKIGRSWGTRLLRATHLHLKLMRCLQFYKACGSSTKSKSFKVKQAT